MKPLISIIVPVYNAESYLPRCIESILSQSLSNIEVIAVNDGSTDNSDKILDNYASKDKRLRVIHNCNKGVSESRNDALKHINGEYVGFVDSDDWIDKDMYKDMYKTAIEKNTEIVMCSYIREFGNHSKMKVMDLEHEKVMLKPEIRDVFIRKMVGPVSKEQFITENLDMHSVVWNKLYHANLIKGIEFCSLKDIGSCEDLLFNLNAFGKANSIVYLNKHYYHYRKLSSVSVSNSYRPDLLAKRIRLIGEIREFIYFSSFGQEHQEALNNRVCLGIMGLGLNIISEGNESGFILKIKEIQNILSNKEIETAFKRFNISGLPIHWRLFYYFAKVKNALGYYFMLKAIKVMIVVSK